MSRYKSKTAQRIQRSYERGQAIAREKAELLGPADKTNEDDWVPLSWKEAKAGQKVWLKGMDKGEFRAYGPHEVANPDTNSLLSGTPSRKGVRFTHYANDLLVPTKEKE